ncbi:uncharacterized protein EMH_0007830 [Eimeria mitis]|uniref:Uncharacterized protein n=1 Tax=Eimeria mitis TaxID=44415 RepID=U6K6B8_9EIME|nr:uncharacterized protein EMH_0007830 [Eimeria mitis]CDJ31028.1 hypothetical protein, conserved [Eimeria mitis]
MDNASSGVHTPDGSTTAPDQPTASSPPTSSSSSSSSSPPPLASPRPLRPSSPASSCDSPQHSLTSVAVALYKAGLQFENQGRLAGAIGLYRQAIKLDPGLDRGLITLREEEEEQYKNKEIENIYNNYNTHQDDTDAQYDAEADVHVNKAKPNATRTWDAVKLVAAADASCCCSCSSSSSSSSNSSSSSRCRRCCGDSLKRVDNEAAASGGAAASSSASSSSAAAAAAAAAGDTAAAAAAAAAPVKPGPIMNVPEAVLTRVLLFLDVYALAKSEADKQLAVAALKVVQARLEGKTSDCYKAAFAPSRAPALLGAPLPEQVVVGSFVFDSAANTVTLEYPGKATQPVASAAAAAAASAAGGAAAANARTAHPRRGPTAAGGPRAPEAPGAPGAPGALGGPPLSSSDHHDAYERERGPLLLPPGGGGPGPLHTAVLQLTHLKGGRWNSKLKWISLSVTSNTRHGPDESFIDVENENFRQSYKP